MTELDELRIDRQQLKVEIERLQEAIAPFAKASQYMMAGKACDPTELGIWTDNTSGCRVTVADFRKAAEVAERE